MLAREAGNQGNGAVGPEETSSSADVQQFIDGLAASSPLVPTESFGTTEEGRQLPLVVIADPKVTTPAGEAYPIYRVTNTSALRFK